MSAFVSHRVPGVALVVMLGIALGCGGGSRKTADVSGTVTYEGLPLESGIINFTPVDGGPTAGGPIRDGKYVANNVTVGRNKVEITPTASSKPAGGFQYKGAAEMKQMMAEKGSALKSETAKKKSVSTFPANAVGNNQEQTIQAGKQTLNFDLLAPGKTK